MEEIIEFRCKSTKDTLTIFGAGKFGEERLIVNRTKASLLFVELWKFLELSQGIVYTEEEVRELFKARSKEFSTKHEPFNKLLLKQDMDWFEENKKK